jgi:vancomycin resistance protein YoaR
MMKFLLTILLLSIHTTTSGENIIFTHNGEEIKTVQRSEIALSPFEETMIDQKKYVLLVEELEADLYEEPINATFDKYGNLVSEKVGHKLNRKKLNESVYSSFFSNKSAKIEIPLETLYPRVDTELLASIKTKKISHYITYFNSRNKERTHNIHLASEAINNHVVFPGETFSFNKVVGKRTVDKGYLPAPVIVRGELTEGVGGGICQVSSTLFNAVDLAGVKILERYSHSRRVPYVPPNRDATVSWYGPDFTFSNRYNQPLLIQSKVIGGQLVIVIYSSETLEIKKREVPSAPEKLPNEVTAKNVY